MNEVAVARGNAGFKKLNLLTGVRRFSTYYPKNVKMEIEELLLNIYPTKDIQFTKSLLERYNISAVLQVALSKIPYRSEGKMVNFDSETIISQIPAISLGFLVGVNSKLSTIEDKEEKRQLELIISDVAFELLKSVLEQYSGDNISLLTAINDSLKTACEFNSYNYDSLQQIFSLEKFIKIQPKNIAKRRAVVIQAKPVYYKWNSLPINCNELCQTLKQKNVIQSTKEFYGLFEIAKSDFSVCFNSEFHDEIFVLFDILYSQKHISPVGSKGHFMPLKLYSVDFEKNTLIKSEPKSIKYTLKKNSKKWFELNQTVNKWIANFKNF